MTSKTNDGVFHDWNPREIEALKRATAALRAEQPVAPKPIERPNLKGCHYNSYHSCYIVNFYEGTRRIYAGRMIEWDRSKALKLQREAKLNYQHANK